jgi:hypothetical protein
LLLLLNPTTTTLAYTSPSSLDGEFPSKLQRNLVSFWTLLSTVVLVAQYEVRYGNSPSCYSNKQLGN